MPTELHETAKALVAAGKGILAADESDGTIKKRFASIGVESTEDNRPSYPEPLGARVTKWRATYSIGDGIPSEYAVWTNAHALARYAALSQEAGVVPIVEPEVLMDGDHSISEAGSASGRALQAVYTELHDQRVDLYGSLLKPNMVLSGYEASGRAGVDEVA